MEKYKINKEYTFFISKKILGDRKRILNIVKKFVSKCAPFNILCPTFLDPKGLIFYCGGGFTSFEHIPHPESQAQLVVNQYPKTRKVDFSPLWACVVSNKVLIKMGPIPDFGRNIYDHGDFCLRAKKLGFDILVTTKIKLKYTRVYDVAKENKEWIKILNKSKEKFDKKWSEFLDDEYKLPVVFHSHTGYPGGYCMHARSLIKALAKKKVKIYYKFIGGCNDDEPLADDFLVDDLRNDMGSMRLPQVVLSTGLNCFANSGDYKIGFTTTEVDGIPSDWVKVLNEMNEIWTTSEFAKKGFKNSGVEPPIFNMREGIDPNFFHPNIKPFKRNVKEKFIFLANFAWGRRKGVDILFETFSKEFSKKENICLIIKALPSYSNENIKEEIKNLYYRKGGAPIYVWDAIMPAYLIGGLYTAANVLIFPTRGEGFGIPPLEALACGVPVITTDYSAQVEYLKEKNKVLPGVELIKNKLEPFDGSDSIYYAGFDWARPDKRHLRYLMRKMYNNYEEYKTGAMITSEYVRREWTWDKSADLVIKRLKEIYKIGG